MTTQEVKGLRFLLKWFIVLTITVLAFVVQIAFANAGFKKVMKSEFKSLSEKLDAHIKSSEIDKNGMLKTLNNTKLSVQDMANQGIKAGWYDPNFVFRNIEQ